MGAPTLNPLLSAHFHGNRAPNDLAQSLRCCYTQAGKPQERTLGQHSASCQGARSTKHFNNQLVTSTSGIQQCSLKRRCGTHAGAHIRSVGADGRTRTGTACATAPSRQRVYQFHHIGMMFGVHRSSPSPLKRLRGARRIISCRQTWTIITRECNEL